MEELDTYQTSEIIGIGEARFYDQLSTEYETNWSEFEATINEGMHWLKRIEFLKDIWKDQTFPQVFRDRAMLKLIGKYHVFDDKTGISVPGGDGYAEQIIAFSDDELQLRAQWYLDVLHYTIDTGRYALDATKTLMLSVEYFDNNLISKEELETLLGVVAHNSPNFKKTVVVNRSDDKSSYSYRRSILPSNARYDTSQITRIFESFPVLEGIFSGAWAGDRKEGHAIKWAFDQLDAWLSYLEGGVEKGQLPLWMQTIEDPELRLTLGLFRSRQGDIQLHMSDVRIPVFDWRTYQRAVKLLGWGALGSNFAVPPLNEGGPMRVRIHLNRMFKLAEKIDIDDFSEEFLLHCISALYAEKSDLSAPRISNGGPNTPKDPNGDIEEYVTTNGGIISMIDRKLANLPNDSVLAQYLTRLRLDVQKKTEYEGSQRAEQEKRDREWREKSTRRYEAQLARQTAAAQHVPNLLAKLREGSQGDSNT